MSRLTLVFVALLCYVLAVSEGRHFKIVKNEEELLGTCKRTCETLPHRTQMFGCERISDCRYQHVGWYNFLVRCDWCICNCYVSNNRPQKTEVISTTEKVENELKLWGTCRGTCDASGLQRNDEFDCAEIRDCTRNKKGYPYGFVRCDYCDCTCVIKGYPASYFLEDVKFNVGLAVTKTENANSVVVGKITIANHSRREQTVERSIETSIETTNTWEQSSSTTVTSGATISIQAPELEIVSGKLEVKGEVSTTEGYSWGSTQRMIKKESLKQKLVVPPHCLMQVSMVGTKYVADVPFTATLVTTYQNKKKARKQVRGILHDATVSDVHLVYGKCAPLQEKRSYGPDVMVLDDGFM